MALSNYCLAMSGVPSELVSTTAIMIKNLRTDAYKIWLGCMHDKSAQLAKQHLSLVPVPTVGERTSDAVLTVQDGTVEGSADNGNVQHN